MKRAIYLLSLLAIPLLMACQGETGKIHSKVEEFLDETMADDYSYDIEKYDFWDSTFSVSADNIAANRLYADSVKHFRRGISYQPYQTGDKLLFVGVKYQVRHDGDEPVECKQTFYMDKNKQGVVCVKEN